MNALELASMIDLESGSIPFDVDDVSSMLRRQHAAIQILRDSLREMSNQYIVHHDAAMRLKQALKDTEEFQ